MSTTTDVNDATYSYINGVDGKLGMWGPMCVSCMNATYRNGTITSDAAIFLHIAGNQAEECNLCDLTLRYGSQTPFLVKGGIDQIFERLPCTNRNCKSKKNLSPEVSKAEKAAQTETAKLKDKEAQTSSIKKDLTVCSSRSVQCALPPATPAAGSDSNITGRVAKEKAQSSKPATTSNSEESAVVTSEDELLAVLTRVRINLSGVKSEAEKAAMAEQIKKRGWMVTSCKVCPTVNTDECYIRHMTSEEHIAALKMISIPDLISMEKVVVSVQKHPILGRQGVPFLHEPEMRRR